MPAVADPKPAPTPSPAPAPPPSPSPAPSPTPSPAPGPSKSSADAFEDAFADLDAAPIPAAKPAPTPKPAAAPPKPAPGKPAAGTAAKPAPAPGTSAEPEPATGDEPHIDDMDEPPPQVAKPGDIRAWAARQGKRRKKAETELGQLRERLQQLEAASANGSPDHQLLAEQLASANKRLEEYEGEMRLTNYQRSTEYKEKYEAPYKKAVDRAYRDVQELSVTIREPNPQDPEHPIERDRQATKADFDAVFQQPLGAATKLAKQLFGDQYAIVLQHRERIRELQESAFSAVEEYRGKGVEREKQAEARTKQEQQFIESAWQKANESMRSKAPDMFDERADDAEGNDLLRKGMAHAELAFDNDQLSRYPLPQQIGIHARIRNWAGAFPRMRRDLIALKAQLEEANATIEELRGSGPGKPQPTTTDQAAAGPKKSLMDAFDEQVK